MRKSYGLLPLLILLLTASATATAADGIPVDKLFPWATFDASIPTQKTVLGLDPGARPLRHAELMEYLEKLAASSPRAQMKEYAKSHEGRKLVTFIVSDETTMGRLEAFRKEHQRRVDPRTKSNTRNAKAVAWIAYGIHGDELSSVDAAAAVAYWLVAGNDARTTALRKSLVVLIDPIENPDGRDRFLAQTRSFAHAVPNPDTEDLAHTTVWPWGRGNHYLFDLNRDWFSMVHPESARSEVIASWSPQLMVDAHEMGADDSYLFSPPRHPFNPYLPPSHLRTWADAFGEDQAKALDERGYGYYTREWNEEFFPGYGSSWASYLGAVGILYEMSSTEGTVVQQRGGGLRTYAEAVEHQTASSISNLETLSKNRERILRDFLDDRARAVREGKRGKIGAWLLPEGRHPERTRKLVTLMQRQSIEVFVKKGRVKVSGRDARTGKKTSSTYGTVYMVPLDQPTGRLVHQILDPHVPMESKFFREEREYLERGKGTRLYETTAWSLALGYDIEALWTGAQSRRGWTVAGPLPKTTGTLESVEAPFAYVFDGIPDTAVPTLAALLQRKIAVRIAEKPFTIGGHAYPQGSFLIRREGNPADLNKQLSEIAAAHGATIRAVATAKASQGPDLGGGLFHDTIEVRVGVFTGWPVSPSQYGAIWRLLDLEAQLRFSALDLGGFSRVDLNRYNVLVFPPAFGGSGAYTKMLGEPGLKRIKEWISNGGTAIGVGSGAEFLAHDKNEITKTRLRREALEQYPPVVLSLSTQLAEAAGPFRATGVRAPEKKKKDDKSKPQPPVPPAPDKRASPYDVAPVLGAGATPFAAPFEQGTPISMKPVALNEWMKPFLPPGKSKPEKEDLARVDARLRQFSPSGTFLRIELDPNLWLTWGLPQEMPALVRSSDTLVAERPVQVAARFADLETLHLGGLLWPEAAGRLAHTGYATREQVGRGQVVLFLNDPEFRGWTLGTRRLFMNAVLLGPGLGTRWSKAW